MRHLADIPFAKTDGTDWHDSPIADCRIECPVCGYIGGPFQAHRKNPGGGWERIEASDYGADFIVVWVPPPALSISAAADLIARSR